MERKLASMNVCIKTHRESDQVYWVHMSVQEAFTLVSMPAFVDMVTQMVPVYELPEMPEKEC